MEFGKDIRTKAPFQNNLREIVTLAKKKSERVVLMSFAYHIPADYSLEAYMAQRLDFPPDAGTYGPVELWGKPEYVIAALNEQNQAIRELAAQNPEVVFIDQQRLMPGSGKIYLDCCHFTGEGCTRFTQHLLAGLSDERQPR
jgi:hypothetical protein